MSHASSPQPAQPHIPAPAPSATPPQLQTSAPAAAPTAAPTAARHAGDEHTAQQPRFQGCNADRIAAIALFPKQARQAIAGLSAEQLNTAYRAGGWTIAQVIHHIADSHLVAFTRMKFVLAEEHPTVKPFNENVWANQADAVSAPVDDSLLILDGLHARMALLLGAQPSASFARRALHPERGDITLADLLDIYAWHGSHHLEAIAKLRKDRGW